MDSLSDQNSIDRLIPFGRQALPPLWRSRYLYLQYETAIKADEFLVMARGSADEMGRAKTILATMSPSHLVMHVRADVAEAPEKARGAA